MLEGFGHDLVGDALDFDVHLEGSDAVSGTSDFEVHVASVVFGTLDVGEDFSDAVFASDEAHCDAGDGRSDRDTAVHHRQGSGAYACHRC